MGGELHIIVEKVKGNKELFVFKESNVLKLKGDFKKEIENDVGQSIKSKVTKVLIGREKTGPNKTKWKHTVLCDHQGNDAPTLDSSFKNLSSGKRKTNLYKIIKGMNIGEEDATTNMKNFLTDVYDFYSDFRKQDLIQNSNKEAAQHAFVTGILARSI